VERKSGTWHAGIWTALVPGMALAAFLAMATETGPGQVPLPLHQPAHQGPVSAGPDDLLLLAGSGFAADDQVMYQQIADGSAAVNPPLAWPTQSTVDTGVAELVSAANAPESLVLRMPAQLDAAKRYLLWVRNAKGAWSTPVAINDPRPLWITPAYVYSTQSVAGLPRSLKVVGRNLRPAPGTRLRVRLSGSVVVELNAVADADARELPQYVAEAALPALLQPGNYRVAVSRDGRNWSAVPGQELEVRPDATTLREFPVSDASNGNCKPDDGQDDTPCIRHAVAAAAAAGTGTVEFGPGNWDLMQPPESAAPDGAGIAIPQGVNLRGVGLPRARITRHPQWVGARSNPMFTLLGGNSVSGLAFHDSQRYSVNSWVGPALKLGDRRSAVLATQSRVVSDIVISGNEFDRTWVAIADGGLPLARIFVTHNILGAYRVSLELGGDRFNMSEAFRIDDSVIAYNHFKPGSYMSLAERQGAMASEMGAGYRVDFSHNDADGASTTYLDSQADARGWRAAFFWHMNGDHEFELISRNSASCTGDKVGDGEAIALDNNGNTFAFDAAQPIVTATRDTVTIAGALRNRQNDREVPIASYYLGHWIQVGAGNARGQARKIIGYRTDPANNTTVFTVAPAWDVVPAANDTRVMVGRTFWQVYVVDNDVDNRQPLCKKSNRSNKKAGGIGVWAQIADSVVAGNRQFDSDGISVQQLYSARDASCGSACDVGSHFVTALRIHGNAIHGEYDAADSCSWSGIMGSLGASPTPASPPPVMSHGLEIDHNEVTDADALKSGAIVMVSTWHEGPPPGEWPLAEDTLIYHNVLQGHDAAPARRCEGIEVVPRVGINLAATRLVSSPVLYANSCAGFARKLAPGRAKPVLVCPTAVANSCECGP
jgi:hypothetical protein